MEMEPQHYCNIRVYMDWINAFLHLEQLDLDVYTVLLRVALFYYQVSAGPFEPPETWRLARECRIKKQRVTEALRRAEILYGLLDVTADGDWIPRIPSAEVPDAAHR